VLSAALTSALDLEAARSGISRDIDELVSEGVIGWTILVVGAGLPVVSLLALLLRRWLALIPLAISAAVFAVWVLYYATERWSNPGQGAWMPAFGVVLLGWLVLIFAFARRRGGPWMDS
jgi:hypothetical protein